MQKVGGRADAGLGGSPGNVLCGKARGDRESQRQGRTNRADRHRFVRFVSGHRDRFFGQFALGETSAELWAKLSA